MPDSGIVKKKTVKFDAETIDHTDDIDYLLKKKEAEGYNRT